MIAEQVIEIKYVDPCDLRPHPSAQIIPMSAGDIKALHEDIAAHGITHALDITYDGRILDGVHRWESAQRLEMLRVPVREYRYETEAEEHLHAIRANLKRRQLNEGQMAGLALKMLPYEKDLAKIRMSKAAQEAQIKSWHSDIDLLQDMTVLQPKVVAVATTLGEENGQLKHDSSNKAKKENKSATKAARSVGVSPDTVYKAKKLQEDAPELFDSMIKGEVSVTKAYQQVKAEEKAEEVKQAIESGRTLTDLEIMQTLGIPVQPYDVWSFPTCDDRFGHDYPGRVPGQLVAHCLYFWTEQGDIVLDPMAGSGTTIDVCKALNREVLAYDAHPCRDDISLHNIAEQGWPEQTVNAKLIFWDPPYFKKVDKGYGEQSISRYGRAEYLGFFDYMAATIPQAFHGRLAFLMSDYTDEENTGESIWFTDYANIFIQQGWHIERYVYTPLTTQSVHPDIVNKFRASKRLARLGRVLAVMSR